MGPHISRDSSAQDVLDSLRRIVQTLRESSRRAEQRLGVSGAQLFVLEKLADGPSQSLNDLASRTFTHQSSVSTVVARLVEQGLVSRQRGNGDARKLELVLTARGRRLAEQTTGAAQELLIQSINRMPAGERRLLALLLGEVVNGMSTTATTAARKPRMFFDDDRTRRPSRNA
jgi:MarR family transcriptional regulator, lower aerobic nicotinate degradation pathway regulator